MQHPLTDQARNGRNGSSCLHIRSMTKGRILRWVAALHKMPAAARLKPVGVTLRRVSFVHLMEADITLTARKVRPSEEHDHAQEGTNAICLKTANKQSTRSTTSPLISTAKAEWHRNLRHLTGSWPLSVAVRRALEQQWRLSWHPGKPFFCTSSFGND